MRLPAEKVRNEGERSLTGGIMVSESLREYYPYYTSHTMLASSLENVS